MQKRCKIVYIVSQVVMYILSKSYKGVTKKNSGRYEIGRSYLSVVNY